MLDQQISLTIAEAGEAWIKTCEASGIERATVRNYRITLRRHIVPYLGRMKLAQLSTPAVRALEDKLREEGRSATTVRVTRTRLSMLVADAQASERTVPIPPLVLNASRPGSFLARMVISA